MSATVSSPSLPVEPPNLDHLVTEDDTPVDIFAKRQQGFLVELLYDAMNWPEEGRTFLAVGNVGLYNQARMPPIVPDLMLSMDVVIDGDPLEKANRSYFVWLLGKVPDVVMEFVSNLEGGEDDRKMAEYARLRIPYYVIFDPGNLLGGGLLRVYGLNISSYQLVSPDWLPEVGLGLKIWEGTYKDMQMTWLRWCDRDGQYVPTPDEQTEQERQRAEQERQRTEQERRRADEERQRTEQERRRADEEHRRAEQAQEIAEQARKLAEQTQERAELAQERADRLSAQLRALGIEPSA